MKNISVIVLCHNNYGISTCIDSVISQMEPDDELIIVDDHSEHGFLEAEILPYSSNNRIYIYSAVNKRGNRAYNRNLGVSKSKNDILLFLDGDMVLFRGSLQAFRVAHEKANYAAFLGNAHGMRFSENHMALHLGHTNYRELARTEQGIQQLIHNPALEDWRACFFRHPELEPYYWIYYYTCICSADRKFFLEVGGFDEALVTWGSEDIDLGYCLSNYGNIGYVQDAHAVHLPHPRNLWDEQLFDRDNIKYLLDKHRTWPFECLISFEFSAETYQFMEQMHNEIASWDLPSLTPKPYPDSIWINVPAVSYTRNTVIWYDHQLCRTSMNLLGISIPCCDQRFEVAHVTTNIFSYPMAITARILQECLRISRNVILELSPVNRRKTWELEYLLQPGEVSRTYYTSSDTMEFEFIPISDSCYQVISPQVISRLNASRSHCPLYLSAVSRQEWHKSQPSINLGVILISFLSTNIEEARMKLENALGVKFAQCYHFPTERTQEISLCRDVPLTLRSSRFSMLFLTYYADSVIPVTISQWCSSRDVSDFILDIDGTLKCLEQKDI